MSVPANPIAPGGGRVGGAGTLTHAGLGDDAARKVDAVAPALSGNIAKNKATGFYAANVEAFFQGNVIRFGAEFSEPVFVTGTPQVELAIRSSGTDFNRAANYVGKGSASRLLFDYTVTGGRLRFRTASATPTT